LGGLDGAGFRSRLATVRTMNLGAALAVSLAVPVRFDRPD
jgi:hypothetical protein